MSDAPTDHGFARFDTGYRRFIGWGLLILVAIAVFYLSGERRNQFIQPGPLTAPHSGISDCASCHSAADQSLLGWVYTALTDSDHHDSALCLDCHQIGESALYAHSQPVESLAQLTAVTSQRSSAEHALMIAMAKTLQWTPDSNDELACRSCHREHNGSDDLVTSDSSAHCQSCHASSFNSFEHGHPEFSRFPFNRRSRILFDHSSHIGKHFQGDQKQHAPANCSSCHVLDPMGKAMLSHDFDSHCGSCHNQEIRGEGRASALGFEVIAIPGIDTDSLIERRIMIGEWPEFADGNLSPFMELLLRSDAHYATVKPILQSLDLLDLEQASQAEIEAVATLAWCIKALLYDTANGGTDFLHQRLQQSLGRKLSERQLTAVLGLLPQDVILASQERWFPSLADEIPMHRAGQSVNTLPVAQRKFSKTNANDISVVKNTDREDVNVSADDDLLDNLLIADEELLVSDFMDDILADDEALEDASSDSKVSQPAKSKPLTEEQWIKTGGWYRDEYVLRYRPTGHADNFIATWLALTSEGNTGEPLFKLLSHPKSPGTCMNCHSIDQVDSRNAIINWRAATAGGSNQFTQFKHRPHLNLQDDHGCQTCHALDRSADYDVNTEHYDPSIFSSNFAAIEKSRCAACHNQRADNQNCLSCHQYHAIELRPVIKHSGLDAGQP